MLRARTLTLMGFALTLLTGLSVPAAGSTAGEERSIAHPAVAWEIADGSPAPWTGVREEGIRRLHDTRDLVRTGTVTDLVLAASRLARLPTPSSAVGPAPLPVGVPSRLAPSLADLLGAVVAADAVGTNVARESPRVSVASTAARLDALRRAWEMRTSGVAAGADRFDADEGTAERLLAATLPIARAIDGALAAAPAPRSGPRRVSAAACDVVDTPVLCVGGEGPNLYTTDVPLLVDLGGDDTYTNAAGGADPTRNGLAASVVLDLGGDDRYETSLPTPSGARVAQGSGYLGGIGVLVDAGGNDRYRTTSMAVEVPALGQGLGSDGVGVLADLGGSDSYVVTNRAPASPEDGVGCHNVEGQCVGPGFYRNSAYAIGQGAVYFNGAAVLADQGTGDDSYLVESAPSLSVAPDGRLVSGIAETTGIGSATALGPGAAVFSDGGGRDTMSVRSAPSAVDPEDPRPLFKACDPGCPATLAWVAGIGASTKTPAVALAGVGPTTWSAEAIAATPDTWGAAANAIGSSGIGGFAGLLDEGGDDLYSVRAVSRAVRRVEIDDGCECAGAYAYANSSSAPTFAVGIGRGILGSVGVLEDAAGDDVYELEASIVARAEAHDGRSQLPEGEDEGAAADAAKGLAQAQGIGLGDLGGAGFLIERGGNDAYRTIVSSGARAVATAARAEAPTQARSAFSANLMGSSAVSWSQGFGYTAGHGELRDLGGDDVYAAEATSTVEAEPPSFLFDRPAVSLVQAAVSSLGSSLLIDQGGTDSFTQEPAYPACVGTRGGQHWVDCGAGLGVGSNT